MVSDRDYEKDWEGWTEVKKPMKGYNVRMPEEMVEQLKTLADRLGFEKGYQSLLRHYVWQGMVQDQNALDEVGEDKYETARKMALNGASAEEIAAFLDGEDQVKAPPKPDFRVTGFGRFPKPATVTELRGFVTPKGAPVKRVVRRKKQNEFEPMPAVAQGPRRKSRPATKAARAEKIRTTTGRGKRTPSRPKA